MCLGVSEFNLDAPVFSKGIRIRVHSLSRWRRTRSCRDGMLMKTEMELKNLKLYLENKSMIEENAKLRKKALLLHRENQILMSHIQKNSNNSSNI